MNPTTEGYNLIREKLSTLAGFIGKSVVGDDKEIQGLNLANRNLVGENYLSYCTSNKYLRFALKNRKVIALIVSQELYNEIPFEAKKDRSFIIVNNPEESFYRIFQKISYPLYDWLTEQNGAIIGNGAVIENGVILGKNVKIGSNSVIKSGTIIGDNVTIGCCSVIGNEGFQMIKDSKGFNMDIPHAGRTKIGNNVYIGDCTSIAKSLFDGYTEIGDYTKIDNQVHIAHNCIVGSNNVITAHASLFGSVTIQDNVWIAPNASIMNKVVVGNGAMVCAHSFAARNVKSGDKVFGLPAMSKRDE